MGVVLVTGGAGFIGSQLVRELSAAGHRVRVLDALSYAGDRAHLIGVPHDFFHGDVRDVAAVAAAMDGADGAIHLAAESHVSRSLSNPGAFFSTNVEGTRAVLEAAAAVRLPRLVHMSTDEVFGAAAPGQSFGPEDRHRPGNPYAASKAAAEALIWAWRHSFGAQVSLVRCTNNFGPRQHLEKAIPCWTAMAKNNGVIVIHGDGSPRRDWLAVADCARGLRRALEAFEPGAVDHLAGRNERSNLEVARLVGARLGGAPVVCGPPRPGQDAAYRLDDRRSRARLGWRPEVDFADGLAAAVDWWAGRLG